MTKLYEVPKDSIVRSLEKDCTHEFKFHNVDGMYSYCHDKAGNICHYVAWMEVEIIKEFT